MARNNGFGKAPEPRNYWHPHEIDARGRYKLSTREAVEISAYEFGELTALARSADTDALTDRLNGLEDDIADRMIAYLQVRGRITPAGTVVAKEDTHPGSTDSAAAVDKLREIFEEIGHFKVTVKAMLSVTKG